MAPTALVHAHDPRVAEFAADVRRDLALTPRQLQSKYLYDPLGSSLFEAICRLPWYRITRAETRLLAEHADAIVDALGPTRGTIVELGCGSGEKLLLLAEALTRHGGSARVHLIDISSQALEQTEQRLTRLQHVSVVGHWSTYEEGLRTATGQRTPNSTMIVLLLGSNIGNFDTPAAHQFLGRIRRTLATGDLLLLGADLVKPERDLLLAYDDPLGITAAFNKNLLVRINNELGGEFDLSSFVHRAVWNRDERRIEMHLVSRADQAIRIASAETVVTFKRGDHIWTESSYKYSPDDIRDMGSDAGFATRDQWVDADAGFALTLLEA
jgi:L-histidine Nalpha-methyltransferase